MRAFFKRGHAPPRAKKKQEKKNRIKSNLEQIFPSAKKLWERL